MRQHDVPEVSGCESFIQKNTEKLLLSKCCLFFELLKAVAHIFVLILRTVNSSIWTLLLNLLPTIFHIFHITTIVCTVSSWHLILNFSHSWSPVTSPWTHHHLICVCRLKEFFCVTPLWTRRRFFLLLEDEKKPLSPSMLWGAKVCFMLDQAPFCLKRFLTSQSLNRFLCLSGFRHQKRHLHSHLNPFNILHWLIQMLRSYIKLILHWCDVTIKIIDPLTF